MSLLLYVEYSDKTYLEFYCRHCANNSCGNFNFLLSVILSYCFRWCIYIC